MYNDGPSNNRLFTNRVYEVNTYVHKCDTILVCKYVTKVTDMLRRICWTGVVDFGWIVMTAGRYAAILKVTELVDMEAMVTGGQVGDLTLDLHAILFNVPFEGHTTGS